MKEERYFFDQDDDGHWYMIPVSRQLEWTTWRDTPYDLDCIDEGFETQFQDCSLGGGISHITFEKPEE